MASPDTASDIIDSFTRAMRFVFNPNANPVGGGTTTVRFLAGDIGLPQSLAADLVGSDDCGPLLWVRAAHRYRSTVRDFPAAFVGNTDKCSETPRAIAVEVGIARCSSLEAEPDWDTIANEAEISLDDSWRIEQALCSAATDLRRGGHAVATDSIVPLGPEGGVIAWTGMAYAQF